MVDFYDRFYLFIRQDIVGQSWGYGISSAAMFPAILVFLSGTKRYRYKIRVGSPIIQVLEVLVAAMRKRKLKLPSNASSLYEDHTRGTRILHTNKYR